MLEFRAKYLTFVQKYNLLWRRAVCAWDVKEVRHTPKNGVLQNFEHAQILIKNFICQNVPYNSAPQFGMALYNAFLTRLNTSFRAFRSTCLILFKVSFISAFKTAIRSGFISNLRLKCNKQSSSFNCFRIDLWLFAGFFLIFQRFFKQEFFCKNLLEKFQRFVVW